MPTLIEATLPLAPTPVFRLDGAGWLSDAISRVRKKQAVRIVVDVGTLGRIISHIKDAAADNPLRKLIPGQLLAKAPIDLDVVVPALAALGAVGGAVGSTVGVVLLGLGQGMHLSLLWNVGRILDVTDDEVVIQLEP